MTTDGIERIRELFEQAIALPPAERAAFLAKACGADHALLREVSSLIEHDALAATEFLNPERPPVGADPARAETIAAGPAGRALADDGPTAGRLAPFPEIAGFQILRELHRGGQGVVYEAHDKVTKRKVAIKILIEGQYASRAARRRFEREIELVASLKHPNIVAVFHSGETTDGRQFCVMDYVRGVPLTEYVRSRKPALEEVLKLFATVCEAVNYAHQKGVIHRDLKPSNILVDVDGVPKVLDFGLAKMIGGPEQTVVSLTGQVVGTLPYMSPEQARGNPDEIDIRTDVYALGVILYELLTGQYPYPVIGHMAEVLRNIAETQPTPPSRQWTAGSGVTQRSAKRLRSGHCPIDDEVETIILRSLAKERERRYQSAGAVASDLRHYLAQEPIEAKKDSRWYLIRSVARRNRVPALVALAFVVLLAAGFIVSTQLWISARTARIAAEDAKGREAKQREFAAQRAKEAETASNEAKKATKLALLQTYIANIQAADLALSHNDITIARQRLNAAPESLRSWEWDWYFRKADQADFILGQHKGGIRSVSFSHDGKHLLSCSDKAVKTWSLTDQLETGTFSGKHASFCRDGTVRLVESRRLHPDRPNDGWLLQVRDPSSTFEPVSFLRHQSKVFAAVITEDGRRVMSAGLAPYDQDSIQVSGEVWFWDSQTGGEILTLRTPNEPIMRLELSSDATRIVTRGKLGALRTGNSITIDFPARTVLRLWDARTGRKIKDLFNMDDYKSEATASAFSPDGRLFAAAIVDDAQRWIIQVWDANNGNPVSELELGTSDDWVLALALSPSNEHLACGSTDKSIKLLSAVTGEVSQTLRGHEEPVTALAFNRDGSRLASGAMDDSLRLWNVGPSSATSQTVELRHTMNLGLRLLSFVFVQDVLDTLSPNVFSPNGKYLVCTSRTLGGRELCLFDASTGAFLRTFKAGQGRAFRTMAFSQDSSLFAALAVQRDSQWKGLFGAIYRAVAGENESSLMLWGHLGPLQQAIDNRLEGPFEALAVYPDASHIVVGTSDGELDVLASATLQSRFAVHAHDEAVIDVAVSHDGSLLASKSLGGVIKVWSGTSGNLITTLSIPQDAVAHNAAVSVTPLRNLLSELWFDWEPSLTFSPNGKYLAVTAEVGVIVWSTLTWNPAILVDGQPQPIASIGFSPNEKHLAVLYGIGRRLLEEKSEERSDGCIVLKNGSCRQFRYDNRNVRIIELATGNETARFSVGSDYYKGDGRYFSLDGRRFVTSSRDNMITFWDTATGEEITKLRDHPEGLLLFAADGTLRNAQSSKNTIEILRVR